MSIAVRLTSRVLIISHGKLVWTGTVQELKHLGKEDEPIESVVARMMRGSG